MSLVLFRQRLRLTEGERSFNYSSAIRDDSTECVCDIMRAHWVCGRAVECTGLENRRGEIHREFESHRTRQVILLSH